MNAVSVALSLLLASPGGIHGSVSLSSGKAAYNAVVWLEGGQRSKPMTNAVVDQREREFIPHVSAVTVGTTVRFPNDDTIFHNVFADYNAKKFDLGRYARGQTKRVTFDKPGVVALMCSIHPDMSAYIVVVDTPYYALADGKGNFSISGVPEGTYTLHAWHESGQTDVQRVTVRSGEQLAIKTHR